MLIDQLAAGIWSAALWAQTATTPASNASPPASTAIGSVWDFMVKGGPVMIPIGICSLVALSVIIERLVSLRRRQIIPPEFLVGLKAVMGDPKRDSAKALEYCAARSGPLAGIFSAAIKKLGQPLEILERAIQEAGRREIFKLRKYLRSLGVVGSVAPLLGLLGTIFGMISAFQTVAASGESLGRTELLAKGIYEALITTAAGLIVAIPTVISHHMLSAKVERLVFEMDALTIDFVEQYASSSTVDVRENGRAALITERALGSVSGDGRLPINTGHATEGVDHVVANG